MKMNILAGYGLLLFIFVGGSIIALLSITKITNRMDKLIKLHQIEILRENLIVRVQQVQSHLYRNSSRSGDDVDSLIVQVQEMDRVMDSCVGCHHSPELTQGLVGIRDMANDYKTAISRLVTASANPKRIASIEHSAQNLGQELLSMTQGMAFTANVRLQQKTHETVSMIRKVRYALYFTLVAGLLTAFVTYVRLIKSLDRQLGTLIDATRRISGGAFQHRVDIGDVHGGECKELGEAFNTMTQNLALANRQLVQSAKLAAIGELSTNIVYEVNNPLASVLGNTGLLLKADDIPDDKKTYLKTIESEALRARGILNDLLDFSRRKPPQFVISDIAVIIQDTLLPFKDQARRSRVEIKADCPSGLPLVAMDRDDMKQVFSNLIHNACFSMPKGGTLTLRCRGSKDLAGKEIIAVELIDTGNGIPEDELDKIFDPVFTSRLKGDGKGLGLSISYMIVQNHGGMIEVESKVGAGSTFRVILPT